VVDSGFDDEPNRSPSVAIPVATSGTRMGATGGVCSAVNSSGSRLWLEERHGA